MTVRNEGATLERAIQSVASVVDEIIVGVDERSEDETLRIAQKMATCVFTFRESSPPDFARMRNRALERVRTDWAIMLDGHEWVEHPERIPRALETTAWSLETRILFEPDERRVPALSYVYPKIHRRGVRFVGPSIHEEVSTPIARRSSAPQIAVWHERVPGRAMETRGQEKTGVELEILRATWKEQGDRRALFYLANGLRGAGRHDEAIEAYEEYLRAPCWNEEGWQARLFLARSHAARGDWQAAKTVYERAILQWPERAEAMVGMGDALLETDEPGAAAAWFRVATTLKEPETARLFVEVPVYRWGAWHGLAVALWRLGDQAGAIRAERHAQRGGAGDWAQRNIDNWLGAGAERWGHLFDLGVRSYETGDHQAGNEACERLLSLGGVPEDVREQTRRNQVFYAPMLAELVASATVRELTPAVPAGWSRFNPTIAVDEEGYRVIVRSANYTLDDDWMHYTVHDDAGVVRTTNYLMELGADLTVRRVRAINDATGDETFPFPVVGFEDCRLFRHRERWWVTATVLDRNPAGVRQMALLELDGVHLRNLQLLSDAGTGRHEKNWMPVAGTNELAFIYSCSPTVVLRYDAVARRADEVVRRPGPTRALSFRGGSQAVRVDVGWLFIIHESVDFEDGSRVMPHRFVLMSLDFNITHMSRQFFFLDRSVEFCAGLARRGETLVAAFGSRDRAAYIVVMELADALGTLAPADGWPQDTWSHPDSVG